MLTLVTGATGLLGNNVVRLLLERGAAVRVLARKGSDPRPLEALEVDTAHGDVRDQCSVRRACQDVSRVVHAAAVVHIGWSGWEQQRAVNVEGTRNVAVAARAAGARLVHVSSVDALGYGTRAEPADEEAPLNGHVACPYVVTKRAAEQVVLEQVELGLDAVIVNPVFMLGPWDWKPSSGRMLLAVARGKGLLAPPGGNDFCDVRDVAGGILAAAERGEPGRRYILGGEPLSYLEAWRMFASVSGARPPLGVVGRRLLRAAGVAGSLWGRICRREPDVNSAATAMSMLEHHFQSARAVAELGYSPRPAREAAEAAWDWFRRFHPK
ncbi:MAG TPA: NAD-dependent epimerase/dehydratase family protein [Pirellulales bacterium]|jgi:dihydroflavonol-4-reductase|nr:NAD-dependent epimerase/dehydratase family protein [Pirellulales bacterium]